MSKVSVIEATKLTGKSKTTLYSDMEKGILSFELDIKGRKRIDVAELQRVYGLKQPHSNGTHEHNGKPITETSEHHGTPENTESETVSLLKSQIEHLETEITVAREREKNLMELLKREQEQTHQLMLPAPKRRKRTFWDIFRLT